MSDSPINLSIQERVVLANQFRMLEQVDPNLAHEYREKAEILEYGFEGQYSRIFARFQENRLPTEECRLVEKILLLHSWLVDWDGKANIDVSEYKRAGFDANTETDHMSYARFLYTSNPGGYPGVEDIVDVHRPTLTRWRNMVEAWENRNHNSQSEADVANIISAGLT